MDKVALAVGAHPDDIEFMMAGTLLRLGQAGYRLHYMTVANGSCGSVTLGPAEIARVRLEEARAAAATLGAEFHPPLVDDIQIYCTPALTARLTAVVRQVCPHVLLLPSLLDYMEDHVNTARLMATAAFCRNMPNFPTDPPVAAVDYPMAVYHALPYGLRDPLRRPVCGDLYVDIGAVMAKKRAALACHASQKVWLDQSQGVDSYLTAMEDMAAAAGRQCGRWLLAEGWQRRLHLGFGPEPFDPLTEDLGEHVVAMDTQGRS